MNDFQIKELENASQFLDNNELFDNAYITGIVKELLTTLYANTNGNKLAQFSIAQLFYRLVHDIPILPIDENDEWEEVMADDDDYDEFLVGWKQYRARRFRDLKKRVYKDGTIKYADLSYWKPVDENGKTIFSRKFEKEVELPYSPDDRPHVVQTNDDITCNEIIDTMNPMQRQVILELVELAYEKGKNNGGD